MTVNECDYCGQGREDIIKNSMIGEVMILKEIAFYNIKMVQTCGATEEGTMCSDCLAMWMIEDPTCLQTLNLELIK